jgi:outer membrane protein
MSKSKSLQTVLQGVLLVFAILVIVGMYQLPKVVVNDKDKKLAIQEEKGTDTSTQVTKEQHKTQTINPELQKKIALLKKNMSEADNSEKKITFADSIARLFESENFFDSTAYYKGYIVTLLSNKNTLLSAGDAYYQAFQFSLDNEKAEKMAQKARTYYEKLLKDEPKNLDVKAKVAMTYTQTQTMKGVTMLREIITINPHHELALFNLGVLSIQSKQFDKAAERFELLLTKHPQNIEAKLYLGQIYAELGKKAQAVRLLEQITQIKGNTDSLVNYKEAASDLLKQLK